MLHPCPIPSIHLTLKQSFICALARIRWARSWLAHCFEHACQLNQLLDVLLALLNEDAVKVLSSRATNPRKHEWKLLCHLVRYLKEHDSYGLLFTPSWPGRTLEQRCLEIEREAVHVPGNPFGGDHLLESVSDASWCSEPGRLSVSCSVIYLNGNPIFITNKRQKSMVLSSCESELHGTLLSLQEAIPVALASLRAG